MVPLRLLRAERFKRRAYLKDSHSSSYILVCSLVFVSLSICNFILFINRCSTVHSAVDKDDHIESLRAHRVVCAALSARVRPSWRRLVRL